MYYICLDTPIGKILIVQKENKISNIIFEDNINLFLNSNDIKEEETNLLKEAKKQLTLYFEGKLKKFDLPLLLEGTAFQIKVWKELLNISYGQTSTYKKIAHNINSNGYRAVGNANNKNKIPIIIPCHRVVGSSGKLVGYAGGINIKEKLLSIEKGNSNE